MKLSQLLGPRAEAEVDFPGGQIVVGFRPGVLTPRYLESEKTIPEVLADMLLDWPLETEDGESLPPTAEGLQDLPMEVQEAIYLGIMRARRPNLNGAGSSPKS